MSICIKIEIRHNYKTDHVLLCYVDHDDHNRGYYLKKLTGYPQVRKDYHDAVTFTYPDHARTVMESLAPNIKSMVQLLYPAHFLAHVKPGLNPDFIEGIHLTLIELGQVRLDGAIDIDPRT